MPFNVPRDLDQEEPSFWKRNQNPVGALVMTLATAALLKKRGFSCALRFYPSGGAGFNIYKYCQRKEKPLRRFAVDYHPIWDDQAKANISRLHYHRGESYSDIRKHRPYQGGF